MAMGTRYPTAGSAEVSIASTLPRPSIVLTLGLGLVIVNLLMDPYWQGVIGAIIGPSFRWPGTTGKAGG